MVNPVSTLISVNHVDMYNVSYRSYECYNMCSSSGTFAFLCVILGTFVDFFCLS